VQELDSRLDALRHQAANLREAAELAELTTRRSDVDGRARDLQLQVDDLTRAQRRADDDVEQVKGRRLRDQQRLDSGAVKNPKDLERLQRELVALDKRISDLEDIELEVMERLEAAQSELGELRTVLAEMDAGIAELSAAREERMAGLRDQARDVTRKRAAAAEGLPADLLDLYEKLRKQKAGVGAALLRARQCSGCSLELNSGDLATIAKQPSDAVVRCEECGRILVRTAESGL
jgi:predicted  nucleic acid-binding Zn-ribbon protein